MRGFWKKFFIIIFFLGCIVFLMKDSGKLDGIWGQLNGEPVSPAQEEEDKGFSKSIVQQDPYLIPEFSGKDYVVLNDNVPNFTRFDLENFTGEGGSGQQFSRLDNLGRCGAAWARLDRSMKPVGERGEIGMIKPTGWVQAKYEGIIDSKPPYLYNRSHLIAYGMSGENANERNLITGTRHMNAETMLEFENEVMRYLSYSRNHVMYRVTPYFKDRDLLARGVEMEAYSIEDGGRGICFHVFVYNYQPGIEIDYRTGRSQRRK